MGPGEQDRCRRPESGRLTCACVAVFALQCLRERGAKQMNTKKKRERVKKKRNKTKKGGKKRTKRDGKRKEIKKHDAFKQACVLSCATL